MQAPLEIDMKQGSIPIFWVEMVETALQVPLPSLAFFWTYSSKSPISYVYSDRQECIHVPKAYRFNFSFDRFILEWPVLLC